MTTTNAPAVEPNLRMLLPSAGPSLAGQPEPLPQAPGCWLPITNDKEQQQ